MRFEQQLVFNASNEWVDEYINYTALKAAVYRAEKEALSYRQVEHEQQDEEQATLLGRGGGPAGEASTSENAAITPDTLSARFKVLLDAELAKIEKFYTRKEGELFSELEQVREEIQQVEEEGQFGDFEEESDEESGESENEDENGATKLLKKSTKLFKSVVGAGGHSGSHHHHNRRRSSGAEGAEPPYGHRRTGSTSSGKLRRQRSHTASEGSNNSSTEALGSSNSRNVPKLPAEVSEDIEDQINRTMQAATRPSSPANANGTDMQQSPFSPSEGSKPLLRARASSFGGPGVARDVSTADIWNSSSRAAQDLRITYKMRIQSLFREISQLKEYVTLNQSRSYYRSYLTVPLLTYFCPCTAGFRKILKKFDKVTECQLQKKYMSNVLLKTYPFCDETQTKLDEALQSIIPLYARVMTRGDTHEALRQLRIQLREHVVWERNTIWRDMIGLERKGWSGAGTGLNARRASLGGGTGLDRPIVVQKELEDPDEMAQTLSTPLGRVRLPNWLSKEIVGGIVAVAAFIGILLSNFGDRVEERNCLAILVFASIFWALEVIPLFATSLLVPFLIVVLRVLRSTDSEDRRLTAVEGSKFIFSQMFTGTIVLLVGGFTLAGALSKQNIDKILASKVLHLAGTRPAAVLLAYMGVACFASMWISNVAAPVLCFSLIQPILRTLPPRSSYSKALVLGIALASNLGGMASPIASPQNLIAISYMSEPLSWAQWFAIALPVAFVSIVLIWILLIWMYGWDKNTIINPVRPTKEKFTITQWFVCAVTIATVLLLCVEHQIEDLVGDMGVIALIPVVLFFGTGILRKADFDNFVSFEPIIVPMFLKLRPSMAFSLGALYSWLWVV